MRIVPAIVLVLLASTASAGVKVDPPHDGDPDPDQGVGNGGSSGGKGRQSDFGSGGDASDVCARPDPAFAPGEGGAGRASPPADTADVYAFVVPEAGFYTLTLAETGGDIGASFRVWDPTCSEILAQGEPGEGGEVLTFAADAPGTFPVEVVPVGGGKPPNCLDETGCGGGGGDTVTGSEAGASDEAPSCWPSCTVEYSLGSGRGGATR